jgi:hypothetical protein
MNDDPIGEKSPNLVPLARNKISVALCYMTASDQIRIDPNSVGRSCATQCNTKTCN